MGGNAGYQVSELVGIFNGLFNESEMTELSPGGAEPLYQPSSEAGGLNKIISTQDYFSSALHEISHWCIASKKRRQEIDFGYWYEPDGRTEVQQLAFEKVETKPQSLEWIFTAACGLPFNLSVDNVASPDIVPSEEFKRNVYSQVGRYLFSEMPDCAEKFINGLLEFYRPDHKKLQITEFSLSQLR